MPGEKRRQEWHGGFESEDAAQRGLTKRLYELDHGVASSGSTLTVAEWLHEWLHAGNYYPSTYLSYRNAITHQINPHLGSVPLSKLTARQVQAWVNDLRKPNGLHVSNGGRGFADDTVSRAKQVLSMALRQALAFKMISDNPAALVRVGGSRRDDTLNHWDEDEVRRVLAACDEPDLYCYMRLALSTGMRQGELLALRWRDIDLERGTLSVTRTWTRDAQSKRVMGTRGKGRGSKRVVDLDGGMLDVLREHRTWQQGQRLTPWLIDELVFCHRDGAPWNAKLQYHWDALIERAGVRRITQHGMRHTYATIALMHGVPVKVVADRLGHVNIQTTLNLYGHLLPSVQRDAAEMMGRLLDGVG